MKIAISAESTIDLPKSIINEYDFKIVPFTVNLGEESFLDGEIDSSKLFEYFDSTGELPKTSAVNEYQYLEHFNKLLEEYDAVVHISLSSEISSSCANANVAAGQLNNVYIVDSRTLSTGIAQLAFYAHKLVKQGCDAKDIASALRKRTSALQVSFVINTLTYLYKGGRCSALKFLGAKLLRIKPQILVTNGKMDSHNKYSGKNAQVIEEYCKDTLAEFNNPDLELVFLTYSGSTSPEMINAAKQVLTDRGFKNIIETSAGATISSHCGPKCLGILYFNDGGVK